METLASVPSSLIKMRWREPYVSEGLNRKINALLPHGVVRGGRLVTGGAGFNVTISDDAVTGDSVYAYTNSDGIQVTVREVGDRTLDLTAAAGSTRYIALYVDYTIGATTTAEFRAYTEAELFGGGPVPEAAFVVILGKVDVPGVGPIPGLQVTPNKRRVAWQNKSIGVRDWTQIVQNPGFESYDTNLDPLTEANQELPGWQIDVTGAPVVTVDGTPRSGVRALKIVGAGAPASVQLFQLKAVPVVEGRYLKCSLWAKGTVWVADDFGFEIQFLNSDLSVTSPDAVASVATGTFAYTEVENVIEVPASARWAVVSFVTRAAVAMSGTLEVDDIRVWTEVSGAADDDQATELYSAARLSELDIVLPTLAGTMEDHIDGAVRILHGGLSGGVAGDAGLVIRRRDNKLDPGDGTRLLEVALAGGLTIHGEDPGPPDVGRDYKWDGSGKTMLRVMSAGYAVVDALGGGGTGGWVYETDGSGRMRWRSTAAAARLVFPIYCREGVLINFIFGASDDSGGPAGTMSVGLSERNRITDAAAVIAGSPYGGPFAVPVAVYTRIQPTGVAITFDENKEYTFAILASKADQLVYDLQIAWFVSRLFVR